MEFSVYVAVSERSPWAWWQFLLSDR